ncbi:MAG: transposase [Planctomycetota bacterium]
MKSKENAQLHSLAGAPDRLVKQRTAPTNKTHNVLNRSIKRLDDRMSEPGKNQNLEGHSNLSTIKGIGERSATVLLWVIGDGHHFADEDELAAYFGIVPRVSDSNETVRHGRITSNGSKIGRTTPFVISNA